MRTNVFYLTLLGISIVLASCKKDEIPGKGEDPDSTVPLVVTTDMDASFTKSSNLKDTFIAGDQIGLYATNGNISNPYNAISSNLNVKATLTGNVWSLQKDVFLSSANATIFATYPYNEAATDGSKVPVSAIKQIDYMYGTHQAGSGAINNGNAEVKLSMRHACSMVQFMFKTSNYTGAANLTQIEIRNNGGSTFLCTEGTLNITTGQITANPDKTDPIILRREGNLITGIGSSYPASEENDACIKAFVLPSHTEITNSDDVSFVFTIDGKEYEWKQIPTGTSWQGGKKNTYYVNLSGTELIIENIIIEPWTTGSQGDVDIE